MSVPTIITTITATLALAALVSRGLRKVFRYLDFIEQQMRANGGASLRDQVDLLRGEVATSRTERSDQLAALEQRMAIIEAHVLSNPHD